MKWFTKNHSRLLFVTLFFGGLLSMCVAQKVLADGHNSNYSNNYDGNRGDYHRNYNYNQQYYISPWMTSTQPYYMNQNYSNYDSSYPYYNYNNNYYNSLSVSCTANKNFASVGEPVTWTAYVYGGSRNYSYTWSGTDNPTSLNANSINVSYGGSGTKSMSVTVWSANGQSSTAYCGQVTINQYQNQYYPYAPPQLYQYPYAY